MTTTAIPADRVGEHLDSLRGAQRAWEALPDDVKAVATAILAHRVLPRAESRARGLSTDQVVARIVEEVPAPVPVGAELRMGATVAGVEEVGGGVQVVFDLVFEIKDAPKPACVAQVVYRYFS